MRTLSGRTVALLESRQIDEMTAMVERFGAIAVRAPAVRERPVPYEIDPLLDRIASHCYSVVIALTGAGVNALFASADQCGRLDELRCAMAAATIACRGPKPQGALKRHGLLPRIVTVKPHTTQELLMALEAIGLDGERVLLLHYGELDTRFSAAVTARGATVDDVCLYEWALPDDITPLRAVIGDIVNRKIDALLVTSQVQFRFLLEVARTLDSADALIRALNEDVVVGAVGPVCASALRASGVVADVLPASPNSASLVGALADYFALMSPVARSASR
jgi:uroporphyrinogen-III synthase